MRRSAEELRRRRVRAAAMGLLCAVLALLSMIGCAGRLHAQSVPGPTISLSCNVTTDFGCTIWTPQQWIDAWSAKVDVSGGSLSSPTVTGTIGGAPTASGLWTFSGGLAGALTGHASSDLATSGGTLTGELSSTATGTALNISHDAAIGGTLTLTGALAAAGLVTNADLANSSMTIAGHSVALGGTQALAAADLSNGTSGSGAVLLAAGPTVTGSFTATGLVTNADLANSSMTIAGHSVALGGTQALAAGDLSNGTSGSGEVLLAVGPTVTGSFTATGLVTNADLAYDATSVNGQSCGLGSACTVAAAASTLTGSALASNVTTSSLTSAAGGAFGSAAYVSTGTSGGVIGLLNANKTDSGTDTFSGPMTLSYSGMALIVDSNASIEGTANLGNASGNNYVQIAGSSSNPSISIPGSSGASLLIKPSGSGAVNIQNGGGGNMVQFSGAGATAADTLQIYTPTTAATPIRIGTQNSYGLDFQGIPIEQSRTIAMSGSEATFENKGRLLNFTATGATTDTANNGPVGIIQNDVTFGGGASNTAFTCGFCGAGFNINVTVAAYSIMHEAALSGVIQQSGAPGAYSAWAGGTSYSYTTPSIVASGKYYYVAQTSGTSGSVGISASCTPSASASLCWDGGSQTGVQWQAIDILANETYLLGLGFGANASYNAGGSLSGGSIGVAFGGNIIGHLYSGATYYAGVASFEFDTELDAGSSVDTALGVNFVHQGPVQGAYSDVGVRIGATLGSTWLDGIAFGPAIDPNGTAIIFGGGSSVDGGNMGPLPFSMAGALDMMDVQPSAICSGGNVSSGGAYGYGLLSCPADYSGGYFYLRTRAGPSGIFGNGDIYTGTGALHAVSGGVELDTFQYAVTSSTLAANGDGANWSGATGSNIAHDGYGDEGTVTVSGGAVTSVTLTVQGVQQYAQLPPAGNVTWYPGSSAASPTATGNNRPPTPFTVPAANYARALGTFVGVGNTNATSIAIGNSGSTTTIAGVLKGAAGTFTADGTTATTMTSLGPSGAHTTVQEWFTITDAAGTARYIPAY